MKHLLTEFAPGAKVRIVDTTGISEILRRRLLDMGLMDDMEVIVKRVLPFGGPLALESNGQWLGLRRKDAARIEVESV